MFSLILGTLRNDDVAWVDVVRDPIYTEYACVHILPDYFPDVANTRRRETGGFEVVVEENMAAEVKGAQTAKKR